MTAFDQFSALILSLGQRWGIDVAAPIMGFTVRFESGENSLVMLRLDDEETHVVLGIESSLPDQCKGALDSLDMRIFMLRRIYAARFGSETRYGLRTTSHRIAAFQPIPLANANVENINAVLAAMSARLNAMKDVAALFTPKDKMLAGEGRSGENQLA
jgi:hypothetical protein